MKRIELKITALSLLFCLMLNIRAQNLYNVSLSYQYGSSINYSGEPKFGNTVPSGVELNFNKQRCGEEHWEKIFNYPQTGWSLSFIDYHNKYLGSSIAVNRYMNYFFIRKKSVESFVRLSAGFLYATKIYGHNDHANKNYNNAISQHLNFSAELGLGVNIYPTSRWSLNLGATLMHVSNGAMSQPNDGLNLLLFKCGVGYVIGDRKEVKFKQPDAIEDDRSVKYNVFIGSGIKQIDNDNEEKYRLLTMAFYADKKVSRVNALNAGIDVFMNRAVEYSIENSAEHKGKDFKRIGVSAGHEFFINKLGVLTQFGYHVYSPYPAFSNFYQKFGLKYYLNDIFFAAVNLRIFKFEISDEITWGIGVRL